MDDRIIIGSICFVLAILLQGLGEITLFTSRTDFSLVCYWSCYEMMANVIQREERYRKFDYE